MLVYARLCIVRQLVCQCTLSQYTASALKLYIAIYSQLCHKESKRKKWKGQRETMRKYMLEASEIMGSESNNQDQTLKKTSRSKDNISIAVALRIFLRTRIFVPVHPQRTICYQLDHVCYVRVSVILSCCSMKNYSPYEGII